MVPPSEGRGTSHGRARTAPGCDRHGLTHRHPGPIAEIESAAVVRMPLVSATATSSGPGADPRKGPCQFLIARSRPAGSDCVIQEPQRQWTVDVDPHLSQVPQFPLDFRIGMRARRAGRDSVESREPREITAQGRTVPSKPVPHGPPPKCLINVIDALDLARPPAKDIPEERIGRVGRILGTETSLDLFPMIVVEILLLIVRQPHEEPVLNLLALRERPAGRVQALEDLLWIFLVNEADAYHPETLKAVEQPGDVIAGD